MKYVTTFGIKVPIKCVLKGIHILENEVGVSGALLISEKKEKCPVQEFCFVPIF